MIYDYMKGRLVSLTPQTVTLEVNGIGYLIYLANPFCLSDQLKKDCHLFIHQVVREDDESLYGFIDEESRRLFQLLIGVSGIGAKSALAILASEHMEGFAQAVENADQKFLTKFPGVGKKTAAQIILDLQGKLVMPAADVDTNSATEALDRCLEALKNLGYSAREIQAIKPALEKDSQSGLETEALLKLAFKMLLER